MEEALDGELPEPENPEEDTGDALTTLLVARWPAIAAIAWDGFSTRGRGVVVLTEEDGAPRLAYRPGSPCPCHQEMVEGYDPDQQLVIAHCATDDDICCISVFGGWPAPPEAAAFVTAADRGATIH